MDQIEHYPEQIDLKGDGRIVLYKRDGMKNPKYQVRIRVPDSKGYKRVSTKTADLQEAEYFAQKLYDELALHVKAGGALNSKTFTQVFDEWAKMQQAIRPTLQGGKWDSTIERVRSYALKYFGSMKVDKISAKDFAEYWLWRKVNFSKKPPTNGTLRREKTCLVPLFKFAKAKGYIAELPDFAPPKVKPSKRPTFTPQEWSRITRMAREWVKQGKNKATWRDRYVAWQCFLVLANSGLRVGEARSLKWSDLRTITDDDDVPRMVADVYGKTGERDAVFQPDADKYIKRIYDLRCDELGNSPDINENIFVHPDGKPIQSMKKAFNSLLEFCEIPIEKREKARTIYSLRHFYATQRLSNEVNPFLVAKQMGTSVEMLEKHYGQIVTSSLAVQLTKGPQKAGKAEVKPYPFD